MRYILAALLCLLLSLIANAQTYRFKIYNSTSGLPNNQVYSVFQDHLGYIWFGTEGGLCRYDGVSYKTFDTQQGLVNPIVRGIIQDNQKNLWLMTRGGLSRFDGKSFTNFTIANGLADNETRSGLQTRDGLLWFGTAKGLSKYDGKTFTNYGKEQGLPPGLVGALLEDKAGTIWIGIRGNGLVKFENNKFTVFGINEGLSDLNIFGLALDANNNVWIATGKGVCSFNGKTFRCYKTNEGLASERGSGVLVDHHNRIWFATYGGGISRIEEDKITVFNRNTGLPDNYLITLFEDYEGNIWGGTMWNGAFRFGNELFANYTKTLGLDGLITGVQESSDETLWFSSISNGLFSLDKNGKVKHFTTQVGLQDNEIWALLVDSKDRVWTVGHQGASYYAGNSFKQFPLSEIGEQNRITAIIENKDGKIWFGSNWSGSNGIFSYDGNKFTRYSEENGLAYNQINSFASDKDGNLWICTYRGLTRFDGRNFTNYTRQNGLPDNLVTCAYEDEEKNLWVGTARGLAKFDGKSFQTYTTSEGLISNFIRTITSNDGLLWVGTSGGLSTFNGKSFRNYTVKDGLISDDVSLGTFLRRKDKSIWFGTTEGASRYLKVKESVFSLPPKVYINGVRLEDNLIHPTSKISLAYNQNTVSFEYVGLSFTDENQVRYKYFLEGFEKDWSNLTQDRVIRFTNLPAGDYRFLVKARSSSGLWSEPQILLLEIRLPYWQTWWFRLSGLLFTLAFIIGIYSWRVASLKYHHNQRLESLTQLLESIRVINSKLDLQTVLQSIVAESATLIDGEPGGIALIKENKVVFEYLWNKNVWEKTSVSFPINQGIAGIVAATGTPIIVNDINMDTRVIYPDLAKKYGLRGLMDVPILNRDRKVIGVLDIRLPANRVSYTEADSRLLESLAEQAAIAIENAELYGSLEEKNLMIVESLKEIEKLYSNEQEVNRRLQELNDKLKEVNELKTNFMVVTSHEMRTPLTVLKGYHEILLEVQSEQLSASQKRSLQVCQRTIDRLINIVNDILEMLRIEERRIILKLTKFDLKTLIDDILAEVTPFIEKRKLKITLQIPNQNLVVLADQEKLRLVILNLLQNAIKFTHDGGQIQIEATKEGDSILIKVSDDGIGIDKIDKEHIFDKFFTCHDAMHHKSGKYEFGARGAGLGLAIVKSYVEAHGGQIWVESEGRGKGSCFKIKLNWVNNPFYYNSLEKTDTVIIEQ
ncbi:MAG: GAF domain-containing protein [Acidobacteria bacterium]|nr:GAF domain-containing protein [Acidobacteriota bacterium]